MKVWVETIVASIILMGDVEREVLDTLRADQILLLLLPEAAAWEALQLKPVDAEILGEAVQEDLKVFDNAPHSLAASQLAKFVGIIKRKSVALPLLLRNAEFGTDGTVVDFEEVGRNYVIIVCRSRDLASTATWLHTNLLADGAVEKQSDKALSTTVPRVIRLQKALWTQFDAAVQGASLRSMQAAGWSAQAPFASFGCLEKWRAGIASFGLVCVDALLQAFALRIGQKTGHVKVPPWEAFSESRTEFDMKAAIPALAGKLEGVKQDHQLVRQALVDLNGVADVLGLGVTAERHPITESAYRIALRLLAQLKAASTVVQGCELLRKYADHKDGLKVAQDSR